MNRNYLKLDPIRSKYELSSVHISSIIVSENELLSSVRSLSSSSYVQVENSAGEANIGDENLCN